MKLDNKKLARVNMLASVAQVVGASLMLFFLYRHILHELGAEKLGLWSLVLASVSAGRLTELGLTSSVVKFVARHEANKDQSGAVSVIQTSFVTISLVMAAALLFLWPVLGKVLEKLVPSHESAQALSILPIALACLWTGCMAGIFLAALDGLKSTWLKNIILLATNLLYFCLAWFWTSSAGLVGIAYAQAVQNIVLLLCAWLSAAAIYKPLRVSPFRWKKKTFKEIFSYSLNFQIAAFAIMLCEPVTKMLMGKFGGLSFVGYYEMASQLILRVKVIIVSANQALIPFIAERKEKNPKSLGEAYLRSYSTVFQVSLVIFPALILGGPFVSNLWIGSTNEKFVFMLIILTVGNFINTIEIPAHFDNLGTGDLKWNTVAHVTMALLNVVLGLAMGAMFGGYGTAIGAGLALIIASLIVIFQSKFKYQIPFQKLLPLRPLIIAAVAYVLGLSLSNVIGDVKYGLSSFAGAFLFTLISSIVPLREILFRNRGSQK